MAQYKNKKKTFCNDQKLMRELLSTLNKIDWLSQN